MIIPAGFQRARDDMRAGGVAGDRDGIGIASHDAGVPMDPGNAAAGLRHDVVQAHGGTQAVVRDDNDRAPLDQRPGHEAEVVLVLRAIAPAMEKTWMGAPQDLD